MITAFALRLAKLQGGSSWVSWAMGVHRSQSLMPSTTVIDRLEELDVETLPEVPEVIEGFVTWWRDQAEAAPTTDLAGLARLEKLTR
jgi:hypothetical protein